MPFNNPLVAGEELIRSAIRSENFTEDQPNTPGTGWKISRNGDATFNNIDVRGNAEGPSASFDVVTANSELNYKGVELSDILGAMPQGINAYGEIPGDFYVANAGAFVPLLEIDTTILPGRLYRCFTNKIRYTSNTGTDTARLIFFYTTDGSQPVPFSGTTQVVSHSMDSSAVAFGGRIIAGQADWIFYSGSFTRFRLLLVMQSQENKNLTTLNERIQMFIDDKGSFDPFVNTGINRYTPSASKIWKTFDIGSNGFRSYTSSGAYDRADFCFQGFVAGPGNRRSFAWFDLNATGGSNGSLNDMVGVGPGDISYLEVYAFFPHWWSSAGGDAVIGYDIWPLPAIGAGQPGSGNFNLFQINYPGRNIGKWFTLFGSAIQTAINDGTFRSIMFGPAPNNNSNFYGYCSDVRIRAGYYK